MKRPYVWILLLVATFIFSGCSNIGEKSGTNTPVQELDSIVEYFLTLEPGEWDKDIVEYWLVGEPQSALRNLEGSYTPEVLFVRAYLELYVDNNSVANTLFEKCVAAADPRKDNDMIAKCYYEMARHVIFNVQTVSPMTLIKGMMGAYEGTSDRTQEAALLIALASEVTERSDNRELAFELVNMVLNVADVYSVENLPYLYFSIGQIYSCFDYSQTAFQYYFDALALIPAGEDTTIWKAEIYYEISKNHFNRGEYVNAARYFTNAYDLYDSVKNESEAYYYDEIDITDHLARIYIKLNDLQLAEKWLNIESELISEAPLNAKRDTAYIVYLSSLAEERIANRTTEEALIYLREAKELLGEAGDNENLLIAIRVEKLFGRAYLQVGNLKIAKQHYQQAEDKYAKLGQLADEECYRALFEICRERGLFEQTITYSEKLATVLNNIIEESKTDQSRYIIQTFESDERQQEIDTLKNSNELLAGFFATSIILIGLSTCLGMISYSKSKENRRLNEKLLKASKIDELTQLNNRHSLNQYLENEWDAIASSGKPVSIVMLDVDYFKKYNDSYGHIEGDNVLADVALTISENIEQSDFAARYGGEEFIIIMPETDRNAAKKRMEEVQKSLEMMHIEHSGSLVSKYVTISIGIASTESPDRYMKLISMADEALYKAKETRNTINSVFCE